MPEKQIEEPVMIPEKQTEEPVIKKFEGWKKGEYNEYAAPGDIVDDATLEYFKKLLSPRTLTANFFQVGEDEEEPSRDTRYLTFEKVLRKWVYRGLCLYGKKEEPK